MEPTLSGEPNIVGTGFCAEFTEIVVTCWHVAKERSKLANMALAKLNKQSLAEGQRFRVGVRTSDGSYVWFEPVKGTSMYFDHPEYDVCDYRLAGLPPLRLRAAPHVVQGDDVGVLGFPMGNRLQGQSIRPFVAKTVTSGVYEGEDKSKIIGPKIAIAESVAGGYSGGPIFSARGGEVVGMLSSTMFEQGQWPAGISLGIASTTVRQFVFDAQAESAITIQRALTSRSSSK
ncbi:MAG: serine protease [Chloroflexota bacterium]|nr:serine protease [Chloroflexota bacterium]